MFKEIEISWSDFKSNVINRVMSPQWVEYVSSYTVFAQDGFILFYVTLTDGTPDYEDFEDNYKNIWNQPLVLKSAESGLERLYSSPRPQGTSTYFCGQGDGSGVGDGQELFVEMTAEDTEKTIFLNFNEAIYPKDGVVFWEGAPKGAKVDVYINHPVYGNVGRFVRTMRVRGDNFIGTQLNSEDVGLMPLGLQLAVKVTNGTTPAAFDLWGLFEIYRETIV